MNILLATDRTLCKQLLHFTLDALATEYAVGTAYSHFPYESTQRSYIELVTPAWNSKE